MAKSYISNIKIDSLPIWKGEATIDDFELNHGSINQILEEANSRLRIEKVATSRIKAKIPVLTPGKNPISISIHSLDLGAALVERKRPKEEKQEPPPTQNTDDKSKAQQNSNSFVTKLTSNIEIIIDGLSIGFNFKGISVRLVVSNLYIHIDNGKTTVTVSNLRGLAKNQETCLTLIINKVGVNASEEVTDIDVENLTITFSNPDFFDLIKDLSAKITIDNVKNQIKVRSKSQVKLAVNLTLIKPVLDIVLILAVQPVEPEYVVLPDLDIKVDGIYLQIQISKTLGFELSINKLRVRNGEFELRPLDMRILVRNGMIPVLEPIVIKGTLKEVDRELKISTNIELLKLAIPISKDLVDQITNIKLDIPQLPPPIKRKKPKIPEHTILVKDSFVVSTQGKIVSWEFPHNVVPSSFSFGGLFALGDKIMLRVWDPSCNSFIAFSSFEISKLSDTFSMDETQMIPVSKFQLILPKNASEYPDLLSKLKFGYLSSDLMKQSVTIDLNINQILITLESLELPAAAISVTKISAKAYLGPLETVRCTANLGLSVMLTNLRNQTMCSIFDIPLISLSLSVIPNLIEYIPEDIVQHRSASVIQTNISGNSISASVKIPNITLNVVPSIISDIARFVTTFDFASAVAYRVVNSSDTPFVFQVSTSPELVEVLPSKEKVVTFTKEQVHFIFFPSFSLKIMLNQPGFYHVSETNYVSVEVVAPFAFKVSLLASTQFNNFLMAPIDVNIKPNSQTEYIKKHICHDVISTSSQLLDTPFSLNLTISGITTQSNDIELVPELHAEPKFIDCDVLNMLPQIYLCAPRFCCWVVFREFEVDCINGGKQRIQEFSFLPVLVVKNKLTTHVVTSAGVIPPNTAKYISQLSEQSIVFDNGVSLKVGFPLARGVRQRLMIMGQPALIETTPETNTITISPNYMLYNGTAFTLLFKVNHEEPISVESNQNVYLESAINPSVVFIGLDYKGSKSWSSGFSIPQKSKSVSIKTKNGNLLIILDITESRACVYPMYIALNESQDSVWLNTSTDLAAGTQAQLLLWRGKKHLIAFSLARDSGYTEPIDLDGNEYLVRTFIGSYPSISSSTYITYSVQSKSQPHTIVFHTDKSPPMTIDNQTPLSFDVQCGKRTVKIAAESVTFMQEVPLFLVFNRLGCEPFVLHLASSSSESIITSFSVRIFARVENRGTQSKVTLSPTPLMPIPVFPRCNASLYIASIKVNIYDDVTVAGIPKMMLCLTISPISVEMFYQEGNNLSLSLMLDTLQIDSLSNHVNFPVIFSKADTSSRQPLINLSLKLCETFNGGVYVDTANLALAPIAINVEESLIRNLMSILQLLPKVDNEQVVEENNGVLVPRFTRVLHISDTSIFISLSTQTLLHANFRNIPINLSLLHLENLETFDVSLVQTIIAHYASDLIAAAPSIFTSLSWLGSPENLVKQSLSGIRGFAESFKEGGTIFGGLRKGSLSLVRGISVGALESIVSFSSSLQRSIAQISPFQPNNEEIARRITELVEFPVQGYQTQGIWGIFTGTGKTIVGLITGPTSAVFRLINKTGEAILQQVNPGEKKNDRRIEKEAKELPCIVFE